MWRAAVHAEQVSHEFPCKIHLQSIHIRSEGLPENQPELSEPLNRPHVLSTRRGRLEISRWRQPPERKQWQSAPDGADSVREIPVADATG
ncbi:MAG: hypothetical protein JWL59_92 [Chthoniobacteraceae bacterium]|nr:hypothetical protein [Chthoniobacteraceae bacterium]